MERMRTEMASRVSRRLTWRRGVEVNATIGHPVEQVFRYLADPLLWHRFAPAVAFRRRVDDDPVAIGSRWMATDRIGPFRVHFVDELADLEPHRRVVWISSAPWNARVEYSCEAVGESTRVRATYEGTLGGRLRVLVGWLPRWATRLILAQDLRRLDRLLTREVRESECWRRHHRSLLAEGEG